ncbi:MAG: hypothetical protein F4227_00175 [Gammaproteobacteria bacterium]|nr:hypothetical protein [Gammaproteobacteria bacterium]MYF01430.1 hypothetical protein [Gammaproteobacteria bacterium]MYI77630.1 hypothetical protein [Gammaproteobacteria bacterium]
MVDSNVRDDFPDYQRIQQQFANYIRDPEHNTAPPGIEQRRMDIYKRLFFNNLASFCAKSFKSFRPFVDDDQWDKLIRGFMREHSCSSPYFKDIPLAFVEYLENSDRDRTEYPFMSEMCHLDAMRMQLRLAPDAPRCNNLDIYKDATCVQRSSTVRLLSYQWPVHKLTPATWNSQQPKQPTWLIAFRDRNDQVEVLGTNVRTFRMLEVLEHPLSLSKLTTQLSEEFDVAHELLFNQLVPTIEVFNKRGVILTTHKN